MDVSDETLMGEVARGNLERLGDLVTRYERPLYAFIVRILGDTRDAEDVFQETFLRLWQRRSGWKPAGRFRPWLYTIALNLSRDALRKRGVRQTTPIVDAHPDPSPGPEESATRSLDAATVQRAVEGLPEKQRTVFLLAHYQELSHAEIATVLGIPAGTVKSRLHYAVQRLAELLHFLGPTAARR